MTFIDKCLRKNTDTEYGSQISAVSFCLWSLLLKFWLTWQPSTPAYFDQSPVQLPVYFLVSIPCNLLILFASWLVARTDRCPVNISSQKDGLTSVSFPVLWGLDFKFWLPQKLWCFQANDFWYVTDFFYHRSWWECWSLTSSPSLEDTGCSEFDILRCPAFDLIVLVNISLFLPLSNQLWHCKNELCLIND